MKIRLDHVSASQAGDYFQVLFELEKDGNGAYVLIQRQFEIPDGGLCYLETHDEDYVGHFRVAHASLHRNRFHLELRRTQGADVEVLFDSTEQTYHKLRRILRIMIPRLEVVEAEEAC